ncbi:MAG TPA: NmrA family NAD(P)-binding protein [Polyangiaceae bacterium]|nr:NmrA family NAD(P)-binding protein [Polyangiaceae bacterium]
MFVITGATGNTGSVAAAALLDAGKQVRVVVRNAAKSQSLAALGAEIVEADLSDEAALLEAFRGAEGVYLLSPPDVTHPDFFAARKMLIDGLARVVKAAGVAHVVFLSSAGAQHPSGTGMIVSTYVGEQALRQTGLPVTFIRAAYFMENWASVLQPAQAQGVVPSFIAASRAIPMVATRDIGNTVARALLEGPRGTRIIELAGPVEVSPAEVAETLSKILERELKLAEVPLEAAVPTLTSFGFSQTVAEGFREMFAGLANGKVSWEGGSAEAARGTTSLETVLRALTGKQ